jgi:hypothetical protein
MRRVTPPTLDILLKPQFLCQKAQFTLPEWRPYHFDASWSVSPITNHIRWVNSDKAAPWHFLQWHSSGNRKKTFSGFHLKFASPAMEKSKLNYIDIAAKLLVEYWSLIEQCFVSTDDIPESCGINKRTAIWWEAGQVTILIDGWEFLPSQREHFKKMSNEPLMKFNSKENLSGTH